MLRTLETAVQRTFSLELPCTCCAPAFCPRYHGLPASPEVLASKLGTKDSNRDALYAAYRAARTGEERVDAFRALTYPFNSY
jgi:hypothetical protein